MHTACAGTDDRGPEPEPRVYDSGAMASTDSSRISPTAHYTGFVWYRNHLSDRAFRTRRGWLLYHSLQPLIRAVQTVGAPSLEDILMARHLVIDHLLAEAVEAGIVGQVVEVAAGLSPRGCRFMERFGDRGLVYVEGDLAGMCARKRDLLAARGPAPGHHIVELDALADRGPRSLAGIGERLLDPAVGTAIVTEGLLSYFPRDAVEGMWSRFAGFLGRFPHGRYFSNLHVARQTNIVPGARTFITLLSAFARGRVHFPYPDVAAATTALHAAGFAGTSVAPAGRYAGALDGQPARLARAPVAVISGRLDRGTVRPFT